MNDDRHDYRGEPTWLERAMLTLFFFLCAWGGAYLMFWLFFGVDECFYGAGC